MVKSKVASLKRVDPPAEDPWTHLLRDKGPKARASWKASKNDIPMVRFVKKCFSTLTPQERCSLADTLDHVEGKIFVGSACSGSEVARTALQVIGDLLKVKVKTVFSCEKEKWKREWISNIVEVCMDDEDGCCFVDIEGLGGRHATCDKHNQQCAIDSCYLFSNGFSCRSLSKLFSQRTQMGNCLKEGEGSSGRTFRGSQTEIPCIQHPTSI